MTATSLQVCLFSAWLRQGRVKQGAKDGDFAFQVGGNYMWLTHGGVLILDHWAFHTRVLSEAGNLCQRLQSLTHFIHSLLKYSALTAVHYIGDSK